MTDDPTRHRGATSADPLEPPPFEPPIEPPIEPEDRWTTVLRSWIRNSPWLAMAVLIHVLAIALMSVIYVAHIAPEHEVAPTAVSISRPPVDLPPPIEEPPEIIDRSSVPVLPEDQEGIVNPDENYIPEAAPGRAGEITDETDPTKDPGIFNPDPEALANLPSGATGGTAMGVGAVGHHGKGVSAFSSRIAGGGGRGGGGLGQGGGGGRGGSRTTEAATLSALVWLKKHQSPDGRWDADGFMAQCKTNTCDGPGSAVHDVGVTGLALLCFLGAGETHQTGSFKGTVKDGLKYLMSVQDEEGCFGERISQDFMYDHACAALAMAEAYGMTQAKPFREPAQKGITFVLKSQNRYGGWRYASPADGDNDTSVTGWMVMVLKSGRISGLIVDELAFEGAMAWIDEATDQKTGRTGYDSKGSLPSRVSMMMQRFPPEKSESMTAVGVLTRIFAGRNAIDDPMISLGADLMDAKPPKWEAGGDIDFYYWYYGTLAMFQVGGPRWDKWNEALKTAVIDHQRTNEKEDEYGSWDPVDPWSNAGGRVYSTALNCLSMEVYYRYPRVFGTAKKRSRPKRPVRGGKPSLFRRRGRLRARVRRSAPRSVVPGVFVLLLSAAPSSGLSPASPSGLSPASSPASSSGSSSASSSGNEAQILGGPDDLDFARALGHQGYPDLAEEVLSALESSKTGGAEDGLRAEALRLELRRIDAYREPDLLQRGKTLAEVVDAMEDFVRDHTGTATADEISDTLPELYRGIGELTAASLADSERSSEAEDLRKLGTAMFERAVESLVKRTKSLAEQRERRDSDRTPDQLGEQVEDDLDQQYMIASYSLARTYYFRSLLFEEGQFARTASLRSAINVLVDFQLEFPDQLLCYEGYIYEGLCHEGLGENEKALESFDFAIGLRDRYERSSNGMAILPPEAADIVSSAVLQKMLLLAETGDHAGAVATARDFNATTPNALRTLKGLAVLAQEAEAHRALGDQASLEKAAKQLIEVDPLGPAGERGRELLGGGGSSSLSAVDTLKLAEASAARGEIERSIELLQRVRSLARGAPEEANLAAQAGLLLGALNAKRGWLHEAAVAWDGSADLYPEGKDAPECLWRAINCYLTLQGQEQRAFYRDRARDRMSVLATRYPEHTFASMAALIEGQQLEAEQEFARAVETYETIAPGTPGHEEALYRAGNASSRLARKLLQQGQAAEAREVVAKSEARLSEARSALEEAAGKTLDRTTQDRLRSLAFAARVSLANLYLLEGVDRPADVGPLFDDLDAGEADASRMSAARSLRIRALIAEGKADQAASLLEAQVRNDPDASGVASSAAALAQALDLRGTALREKDPGSREADALWRKAASFYVLAVRAQVEGKEAVRVDELEPVANRLFAFALHFQGVPKDVDSFVGWSGGRKADDMLEQAARAYEAVLPLTPSYRTLISLARCLGFLGHWEEAASRYAQLFEREPLVDPATRTLRAEALRAKPELIFAYLEWGVCERQAGVAENDPSRLARASGIFESLVRATGADTRLGWLSRLYQIQTLIDRGEYEIADIALRSLERNWPHFDEGKFGLEDRFVRLKGELSNKVFR